MHISHLPRSFRLCYNYDYDSDRGGLFWQQKLKNNVGPFDWWNHWNGCLLFKAYRYLLGSILFMFHSRMHFILNFLLHALAGPRQTGHDDVSNWKHSPRYWPFVRGIHRSPVNSPHKGQWLGPLVFPLICAWINGWLNNRDPDDLKCYRAYYEVTAMILYPVSYNILAV